MAGQRFRSPDSFRRHSVGRLDGGQLGAKGTTPVLGSLVTSVDDGTRETFRYHDQGITATIRRTQAVAEADPFRLSGRLVRVVRLMNRPARTDPPSIERGEGT